MPRAHITPALIAHGGAGGRAPASDRASRRHGILAAVQRGAEILRGGGSALDAVVATVVALEDDPLFNAGYGSVLTTAGRVEMDAAVMTAARLQPHDDPAFIVNHARWAIAPPNPGRAPADTVEVNAGGVALVSRVRNPIVLARAVMELTPHILLGGAGAERLAREAGLRLCRPADLISQRARERWLASRGERDVVPSRPRDTDAHGTVGAVALDSRGDLAAATSTGGVSGKLPGRVGDSAIVGAGVFASALGGASATGEGEAIMRVALCRETVAALARLRAQAAAERAIAMVADATDAHAGVIVVDSRGGLGYAHNAEAMEMALFHPIDGFLHRVVEPLTTPPRKARAPRR
jgi:L-asparaginase / beta-aspartyl-peptidase